MGLVNKLYGMNPRLLALLVAGAVIAWGYLGRKAERCGALRPWRLGNAALCLAVIGVIFYITILSRSPGGRVVWMNPWQTLEAARLQPEIYRAMGMNVILFAPLGMAASQSLGRTGRILPGILAAVCLGLALSCLVEWLQLTKSLGSAEGMDVLCNAVGALAGSQGLWLRRWKGGRTQWS